MNRRRMWLCGIVIVVIGIVVALALTWKTWLRWFVYERDVVDRDRTFTRAIASANKIVVCAEGFDCCKTFVGTNILFVVTDSVEIEAVRNNIRFPEDTPIDHCMCCGWPNITWYRGNKKLAMTSVQHGHAIRWHRFSQCRLLGFQIGYGDADLTGESQAWLKEWLESHGISREEIK